ncbi:hypothetical protein LTR85_000990 [Meristemomyces frigidus]|nr:hypothetical protein LTR85_000990 [Meristemomyces frigidus]
MGFNSYTQTMCIDKAVDFSAKQVIRAENPSQVVTYSSKCVNRLSEIVKSMNVSYSTSIKKGTVEVAGSSNTINEDKIKESDINAVVSVKVVNQTTIVDETATFKKVDGILPGTADFNDRFGDCFISGFIEGGDFNGIVSMRVLDRSKTDDVTAKIKKSLSSSGGSAGDFTLDMDSFSTQAHTSDVGQETETTVSVAWMGGGQIKDPAAPWNMTSVYAAAAAFPSKVALTPQKTWAILTKYKANRSFVETYAKDRFSPLEYDAIASYTAELFDNYMEYKQLLKLVEDMIANPKSYQAQVYKTNSIPVVVPTLIAVKGAFRVEMNKIVQAVDVLSRDPHALRRNTSLDAEPADDLVRRIVRSAMGGSVATQYQVPQPPASAPPAEPATTTAPLDQSSSATDTSAAAGVGGASPPIDANFNTAAGGGAIPPPAPDASAFEPKAMIAPEIWSDLLPAATDSTATIGDAAPISKMPSSLAQYFPPPPDKDTSDLKERGATPVAEDKLQVLSAVVGVADVTDKLNKMINDNKLTFQASAVAGLLSGAYPPPSDIFIYLTFIYQYGIQPMHICIAKSETSSGSTDSTKTYSVTKESTEFDLVKPSTWNADTWSITALVYGAKLYNGTDLLSKVQQGIRTNYDGGKGERWIPSIDNDFVGGDPWGGMSKTTVVFYQIAENGSMHNTVGLEKRDRCRLTDRRIPDPFDSLTVQVPVMNAGLKPKCTRISTRDFRIIGTSNEVPFLRFANGVKFVFQTDGNVCCYQDLNGQQQFKWGVHNTAVNKDMTGGILQWQSDNKLCGYTSSGECIACVNAGGGITDVNAIPGEIVFSDQPPYLEMGLYENGMFRQTWKAV